VYCSTCSVVCAFRRRISSAVMTVTEAGMSMISETMPEPAEAVSARMRFWSSLAPTPVPARSSMVSSQ